MAEKIRWNLKPTFFTVLIVAMKIQSFLRMKRVDKFDLIMSIEGKKNIDEDFVENLDVI